MKSKEFDLFTVGEIKDRIGHDPIQAMDLFADSYVAIYRIQHDVRELHNTITKQHDELRQALDLCVKCLKLVETTIQNRR
ncbi:hypothetical protein [Sporosarcina sp. 6E9]|uniref:hypothetical protein n=1 Tax=Sporosarcina sp. 6E9 TaxID=2819235 RepID=UPI001B309207|nr:hypothetical protein [Sporosarcina sp. 6E9]